MYQQCWMSYQGGCFRSLMGAPSSDMNHCQGHGSYEWPQPGQAQGAVHILRPLRMEEGGEMGGKAAGEEAERDWGD